LEGVELCEETDRLLKLSDLPVTKARHYLATICRDPKVIAEFARRVVKQLRIFRAHESTRDASAILYGLNDSTGSVDNVHLFAIKQAIRLIAPDLVCEIATLKTDAVASCEDDKCLKIIERFCNPEEKTIDILLLKQMGTMGLDADRICVVGTLDTSRSAPDKIQQWGRGGNIWGNCRHYVIVTLKDKMSTDTETGEGIYDRYIAGAGGSISEKEITETWEEAKKKEERIRMPLFTVGDPIQSGASDCEGESCSPAGYSAALHILEGFPELHHNRTIPQIAEIAAGLGVGPLPDDDSSAHCPGDTASEADVITTKLNEVTKAAVRQLFLCEHGRLPNYGDKAERNEAFAVLRPRFIRTVKEAGGVDGTWDRDNPNRIRDVLVLRQLLNVAEQILARLIDENA
jgi:hypothetical protein